MTLLNTFENTYEIATLTNSIKVIAKNSNGKLSLALIPDLCKILPKNTWSMYSSKVSVPMNDNTFFTVFKEKDIRIQQLTIITHNAGISPLKRIKKIKTG